jgi:multidrug efflux pump subunit AcrA (membrane-fusion protein)
MQDPNATRSAATAAGDAWQRLTLAEDAGEYCRAWLALQCEQVRGVRAGLVLIESENRTFVPAAVWPGDYTDVTYLGPAAERCLREHAGQVDRSSVTEGHVLVAYPIDPGGKVMGAVVLDLSPRPESELTAALRALHWGTGRLESMFYQREIDGLTARLERGALALEVVAGLGDQTSLDATLIRLVNDVAANLKCERVAIGLAAADHRVRLRALSGSAWFERRTAFVAALENAMEEALDQGSAVSWPAVAGREGVIAVAHGELMTHGAAYTVPLMVRGRALGALTCQTNVPRDAAFLDGLEALAAVAAPQVAQQVELSRWLTGSWITRIGEWLSSVRDPRRPGLWATAVGVIGVLVALGLAQGEYRVAGRAAVEGEVQRAIVAPFDGFVASARLRAGQRVAAGEELAALDDRDLVLEREKSRAEREQVERKYRDALARLDRTNARILSAQLAEADARLNLEDQKIARARLRSPFDGVVVSGDLSQMLGSPVDKGKLLFEVAPLDAYRVILKVPEEDIRYVTSGEPGQLVLAGMADRRLPFVVGNIGIATAEEGENVFRVEARITGAMPSLRPGMEGVGKISVGRRRLLWIWSHGLLDRLSIKLWRWLP